MTDRTPIAFMFSLGLHGLVVAILLLFAYSMNHQAKLPPKVFELVDGEGDNYGATAAPAFGDSGAQKQATAKTPPSFAQKIRRQLIVADSKAKMEVAKQRAEEQKQLAKEEFDRASKAAKAAAAAPSPPKVERIDAEGIRKGVIGGSTANKVGGAGGNALTREEGDLVDAYLALLTQRLKAALDQPPGLAGGLVAEAEVHILADGTLARARIVKSSGHTEFDRAVLEAIRRTEMPERPKGLNEVQTIPFRTRENDGG